MTETWCPELATELNDQTDVGDSIMPNIVDYVGAEPAQPESTDLTTKFYYKYPSTSNDGRFMPVTWVGSYAPAQHGLKDSDIKELATEYKIPFCHLKAVLAVESGGSGFLLNEPHPARPKILFEGHKFYRHSGSVPVAKTRPDLSYKSWTKKHYRGGSAEWERLEDAMTFHEVGALMSASFGAFQILGENYKAAGCDSVQQFVEENFASEQNHLRHMLNFCQANGILGALRQGNWATFARAYNGPSYKQNNYDNRLAAAAKRCR